MRKKYKQSKRRIRTFLNFRRQEIEARATVLELQMTLFAATGILFDGAELKGILTDLLLYAMSDDITNARRIEVRGIRLGRETK